jgi:hypothetical protein
MGVGVVDEAILHVRHGGSSGPFAHFTPPACRAQAPRRHARAILGAFLIIIPLGARAADATAELLSGESATAVLNRWCAAHGPVGAGNIVALQDRAVHVPASPSVRRRLHAAPGEAIAFRRVRLACGPQVLSIADNWYRPGRLTAAMNQALAATDTPFGAVVRPLGFHRTILSIHRRGRADAPALSLEAVLVDSDGEPFSLVREAYQPALLAP